MEQFSLTTKAIGRNFIIPALVVIALGIGSCSKEHGIGSAFPSNTDAMAKSKKMSLAVQKVLKDFVISQSGGSNQQNAGASGGSTFSNVTSNVTIYSTPSKTIYSWSDAAASGTSYQLTESAGGGLGQIALNGKSFDYNYVLSVSASSTDPMWSGFMMADFKIVVAIDLDGDLTSTDYKLKGMAMFFVWDAGAAGSYNFGAVSSSTTASGFVYDMGSTSVTLGTLDNSADVKMYSASGGHVNVSESAFEMASDAKVKELITNDEYPIEGSVMFE